MPTCPICGISASYDHNLLTHLKGRRPKGHEMNDNEAHEALGGSTPKRFRAGTDTTQAVRSSNQEHERKTAHPAMPTAACSWQPQTQDESYLSELFGILARDKALPKFQFERRIDAILRVFLPELLSRRFGGNIEVVVPEFPLKKRDSNQSTNVDYLLYRHAPHTTDDRWLFLEVKTDSGSVRAEQIAAYLSALDRGMPRLMRDLERVAAASRARGKYQVLQKRLSSYEEGRPVELIVLTPRRDDIQESDPRVHVLTYQDLADTKVTRFTREWTLLVDKVLKPALGVR